MSIDPSASSKYFVSSSWLKDPPLGDPASGATRWFEIGHVWCKILVNALALWSAIFHCFDESLTTCGHAKHHHCYMNRKHGELWLTAPVCCADKLWIYLDPPFSESATDRTDSYPSRQCLQVPHFLICTNAWYADCTDNLESIQVVQGVATATRGDASQAASSLLQNLAPELLIEIFYFVVEIATSGHWGYWRWTFLNLIRTSHVCHRWRELILGTPGLWSMIPMNSKMIHPALTQYAVERSGQHPLQLIGLSWSDEDADLIVSVLPRVEIFAIIFTPTSWLEEFQWPPSQNDAPRLRQLLVTTSLPAILRIPFISSGSSLPYLECINVQGGILYSDLSSFFRPSLKFLLLNFSGIRAFGHNDYPSVLEFLRTLQSMPHLVNMQIRSLFESANFRRPLYEDHDSDPVPLPVVSLEKLEVFVVEDNLDVCAQLLEHIELPMDTFFRFRWRFFASKESDTIQSNGYSAPIRLFQAILAKLAGHGLIRSEPLPPTNTLAMMMHWINNNGAIALGTWSNHSPKSILSGMNPYMYLPPEAALSCLLSSPYDEFLSKIHELRFHLINTSYFEDLHFGLPSSPSESLAQKLMNLEHLLLDFTPGIWWWLVDLHSNCDPDSQESNLAEELPFPRLRVLTLSGVVWRMAPGPYTWTNLQLTAPGKNFTWMLEKMLRVRLKAGLRRLDVLKIIKAYNLDMGDVPFLARHVGKIVFAESVIGASNV